MYVSYSSPTVTNCILWGNGKEIFNNLVTPIVTYCDVLGGYSGVTNIDSYPMFVNSDWHNYHLIVGSPCIDAGINTGAPTQDIDGNPRPIDGDRDGTAITDMGAYEAGEAARKGDFNDDGNIDFLDFYSFCSVYGT